jgi:hypothetical protein
VPTSERCILLCSTLRIPLSTRTRFDQTAN